MVSGRYSKVSIGRSLGDKSKETLNRLTQSPHFKSPNPPLPRGRNLDGYSRLQDTHYKGYTDKDTEKKGLKNTKGAGDYSKKLQFLIQQASNYNKNLSGLRKYSVSQLREAEGMYPEYGQYDKVHNSGWVRTKPSSLKNVDGLSMMDKLLIGDINPYTQKRDFTKSIGNDVTLKKIIKNRNAEAEAGGHGPSKKHIENFNKQLITHLKDYSDIDHLEKRNDPISQLAKTQMENVYDRLEYLTDDKKLEKLTGVDLKEDAFKKTINSSILGSPLNNRGVAATWFRAPDHDLVKAINPKNNDRFSFMSQFLQNDPLQYYMDKNTREVDAPLEDFIQPFRGASKLTQNLLVGHQNRLSEFAKLNPDMLDSRMRSGFLENYKLFGNGNRVMPIGANGLLNITNQRGDGSSGLHTYRPVGMDIIEHFGGGNSSKQADYKPLLSQLYSMQSMMSPNAPHPYKPSSLSLAPAERLNKFRKMLEN